MASSSKNYFTFVKGLITEASPLTFPENASVAEENFVLRRDGTRQRRQGIDFETSYQLSDAISTTVFESQAVTVHRWSNVGNSGPLTFAVVQTGDTLHFYDIYNNSSFSAGKKAFTVDLNDFASGWEPSVGARPISVANGNGYLFVVAESIDPFYIEYDPAADIISTTKITLKVRDFWGVDDNLDVETKPSTLSNLHEYNLLNQGWSQTNISAYFSSKSVYPANNQIWIEGKNSSSVFDPSILDLQYFGNTPAPKGHYILNLFERIRSGKGTLGTGTEPDTEYEKSRPSSAAFYAGRVFYSGIASNRTAGPNLTGYILFSQAMLDITGVDKCYQEADPTSEYISDLVPTDGGYVHIPEAGKIVKLDTMFNSLIVFAENGVWQIVGNSDYGFSADSYQVIKITSVGVNNPFSVVNIEDGFVFWADGGIYSISVGENSRLVTQNLSESTIQTEYFSIPEVAKLYSTGIYDKASRVVTWMYRDDPAWNGNEHKDRYDTMLHLDLVLGAFYKYTISSLTNNSPFIAGQVQASSIILDEDAVDIVVGSDTVVVGAETVQVTVEHPSSGATATKYLCVVPSALGTSTITFGLFTSRDFVDWQTADGTGANYTSFLTTGHDLSGDSDARYVDRQDAARRKQTPYIITHFYRTEDGYELNDDGNIDLSNQSGCLLSSRWGFSDSSNSGRWSTPYQAYRLLRNYIPDSVADTFDYGHSVITTKNRVRGHGSALSLHFESQPGKDMWLLGWQTFYDAARDV